ncbi:MAG: hypothetical protein COB37_03110 [Kordiimonadales bacterium]|nr:MAG: hypothetical protein COB37_03110 [Kordiimonadales bacterium]
MAHSKCLIVSTHHRPLVGGALTVYEALAKHSEGCISLLTASYDYTSGREVSGWQAYDTAASYKITRVGRMRANLLGVNANITAKVISKVFGFFDRRRILKETLSLIEKDQISTVCIGAQDALGWLVAPLREKADVKVVIYVHGEEVSQAAFSARSEAGRLRALQAADAIVAVSRFTLNLLVEKYHVPIERIKLHTNGVDLDVFDGIRMAQMPVNVDVPEHPWVFACGRLVARKGFDQLIEAWPVIAEAIPTAKLIIGGQGPLSAQLKLRVQQLGLENSVSLRGWIPDSQLPHFYQQAAIFAMPNRTLPDGDTEGFGLVFLEAAAMGTPSVAGDGGGTADAVTEGETGLIVDGTNQRNISETIISLLQDGALRQKLGEKAMAHARTQGWQQKTDELLSFFNNLHA